MRAAVALLAAIATVSPARAQPSPQILEAEGPAVVRVVASRCDGGETRSGTGFVWEAVGQVVTALHVVAGCAQAQVFYQGQGMHEARVTRILRTADLALLAVDGPLQVKPLVASTRVPIGETVAVFGYGLDVATREERPLYVTSASNDTPLLSDAINAEARDQLRAIGAPALDTEVLRVDGNLLPGHSGAPVLDSLGQVVGIGSGGLQRGTVGVGWAIRARYLSVLAGAPAFGGGAVPALGASANSPGFATVNPDVSQTRLRCGGLDFVRTRKGQPLAMLVQSSDDRLGFSQIATFANRPWELISRMQFDVWTETRSGAGVAVPINATLSPIGGACVANWQNGAVTLVMGGASLPPQHDPRWMTAVNSLTSSFEFGWGREFLPFLTIEPQWSYMTPRTAFGGFLVKRTAFGGQRPGQLPHAAFETLLAKGPSTIGVTAITRHYPVAGTPQPSEAVYLSWVAAVFATHLSTFPP